MLLHKEPTYKQAFHHAWRVLVEHKILWPLGLFATFLGQMGLLEFVTRFFSALEQGTAHESWGNLPSILSSSVSFFTSLTLPLDTWVLGIWMWVILFGIFALFLFLALVSQAALVYITGHKLRAKTVVDVGRAWQSGINHFWRLFAVHFFRKSVIILLTILISRATMHALLQTSSVSTLSLVIILCVSVVLGFILSCLSIYTVGYIVIEEYKLWEALKNAWILFKNHLLVSFEVGFVILMANILVAVLAVVGGGVFLSPLLLGVLFSETITNGYLWFFMGISGIFCFVAYLVVLGSFFTLITTSVWTYLFSKMHSHGIESRIVHHLSWFIPFRNKK
jgi:hypothetical protein